MNEKIVSETFWPVVAAKAAAEKTAEPVVVIDVGELIAVTGYFVITSARNVRQVRAVVDEVEREVVVQGGPKPKRVEGLDDFRWVLMDYGDFIVHVFEPDALEFYNLEQLWRDAPRINFDDASLEETSDKVDGGFGENRTANSRDS